MTALAMPRGAAAQQPQPLHAFRNLGGSFRIDVPTTWRQLSPNEARRVAAMPGAPATLGYVEPRLFYAVGPVDAWLEGRFDGAWMWVVEQENEWAADGDLDREVAPKLREMWDRNAAATGVRHELLSIRREEVGTDKHRAIVVHRRTTPADGRGGTASLDVHAPAGGQQFSLSFTCPGPDFERSEPEFRRWLATLAFARAARGEQTLGDRLWTPLLAGGMVTLVLLVLYKYTRRRPSS